MLDGPTLAPASGGTPRQLVVLLHGYGSNGADMIGLAPLWRHALPDALFVAPNGPERCPGAPGGHQWWGLSSFSRAALAAGVRRAAPILDRYLDALLERHRLTPERMLLVGFSQGTMMALHVAPRRATQIAGVIGYSGMLTDPATSAGEIRSRPPILLVHGTSDPVVPISALTEAEHELKQLGFELSAHRLSGIGHTVDAAGMALGQAFAKSVLPSGAD